MYWYRLQRIISCQSAQITGRTIIERFPTWVQLPISSTITFNIIRSISSAQNLWSRKRQQLTFIRSVFLIHWAVRSFSPFPEALLKYVLPYLDDEGTAWSIWSWKSNRQNYIRNRSWGKLQESILFTQSSLLRSPSAEQHLETMFLSYRQEEEKEQQVTGWGGSIVDKGDGNWDHPE